MEGEIREKTLQERKVVGSLGCMMKGKAVNMEIKKALHDSITVPTVIYTSQTLTNNEAKRLKFKEWK